MKELFEFIYRFGCTFTAKKKPNGIQITFGNSQDRVAVSVLIDKKQPWAEQQKTIGKAMQIYQDRKNPPKHLPDGSRLPEEKA